MNTIINAIPEYILTAVISAAFYYAIRQSQKLIHSKVIHAKTEQSKAMWTLLETMADTVVASLVSKDMTGSEKFDAATTTIEKSLANQGFTNVNIKAIEAAVQAAYEKQKEE